MQKFTRCFGVILLFLIHGYCRDEDKIMKACYWPNEVYEPCFGGCAEVTCDNPRNHLRPCYPYCEPGCICEDPYVRDDRTHQCVLPQDCSPTQMGIPVPAKKQPKSSSPKYSRTMKVNNKREEAAPVPVSDFAESEPTNRGEDYKKMSDVSRMGNYFNIVIAPPPIKSLQSRKMLQDNGYRGLYKRL